MGNLGVQVLVSVVAAIVVVAGAAGINHAWPIFGNSGGGSTVSVVANPTAGPTAAPKPVDVPVADAPTKGPAGAKVTMIEFSDFECPYCERFVTQTLGQILQNYGDKIVFAFRNFPLTSIHPYSEKAAEAGECANDQGAFWQFHDLMFQNQTTLAGYVTADATGGVAKVVDSIKQYAASLNLDTAKFNQCLDSGTDKPKVDADVAALQKATQDAGITQYGTPTFFINGNYIGGAYPYDTFKQAIDSALAAAGG
ncbi:MAG: thioredoxin domain-containing protein [Dehalococcoidia bacterium]